MLFFSTLLGAQVMDNTNRHIGWLKDIIVPLGKQYPEVRAVVFQDKQTRKERRADNNEVELIGKGIVTLSQSYEKLVDYHLQPGDIYLKQMVMDRQLVDHQGIKVVRANDVLLGKVQGNLSIISIDISMRAILRRLGLDNWPLVDRLASRLVPWTEVTLVESTIPQLRIKTDHKALAKLHPADIANLVEELNVKRGAQLVSSLDPEVAAEVLEEVDDEHKLALIEHLGIEKAGDILEDMSPDQAADILDDLPDDKARELIAEMEPQDGQKILELVQYDDREAGGLMTTDFLSVRPDWTIKQVRQELIKTHEEIPTISYIYVTTETDFFVGVLSLRTLTLSKDHDLIKDLMTTKIFAVGPEDNIKTIASYLTKYNLYSIAVVDGNYKLLGVVMVDDLMRELFPEA